MIFVASCSSASTMAYHVTDVAQDEFLGAFKFTHWQSLYIRHLDASKIHKFGLKALGSKSRPTIHGNLFAF